MAQKPSIPKGTRDFSPAEMTNRNYIFDTIKSIFRLYGFQPIETPAMENLSTLMGKYGEEGDKLLFRILNSGDYLSDFDELTQKALEGFYESKRLLASRIEGIDFQNRDELLTFLCNTDSTFNKVMTQRLLVEGILELNEFGNSQINENLTSSEFDLKFNDILDQTLNELIKNQIRNSFGVEKGLRYDLTVPFARFVVQYRNDISFPFKRYQIQPVWRADRPQKGRYREFYQCDVDIVGSNSLLNEVELIQIVDDVFTKLGISVTIKMSNRKILSGIAELVGTPDKMIDIAIAIDKYDKIGKDGVINELKEKGFNEDQINKLHEIILVQANRVIYTEENGIDNKLNFLKNGSDYRTSVSLQKGVEELETIFSTVNGLGLQTAKLEFDVTLARGLNYYTGAIFEVKAKDVAMGSICGGGRYDDLTGIFGMPNVSGVGISFGADRIYDVLTQLNLFPAATADSTKLMFVNFGAAEEAFCLPVLAAVRKAGINAEIFPDKSKMAKQMTWANNKKIPFVAIVGESEMAQGKINLKNMLTGEQQLVDQQELIKILSA